MSEKETNSEQQVINAEEDILESDIVDGQKVPKKRPYKRKSRLRKNDRVYGILIVEDEKSWSNVYKINLVRKLEKRKRFQVYEARSSKEAVKILIQYNDRIDIVLLDLVIGEETPNKPEGLVLLETIVDRLGLTNLGIFVITAYATESIRQQCQIRGVRYFVDKSQLDFDRLATLMNDYIELIYKPKGIDVGFYIELRSQKDRDQRYIYLKWKYGEGDWDSEYVGNANEIKRIVLPNIITDIDSLEDWQPTEEDGKD